MAKAYRAIRGFSSGEAFAEASAEELRVLLALIDREGADGDELASLCGLRPSRVSSALTLWESEGAVESYEIEDGIEYEFARDGLRVELSDKKAEDTARVIRDEGLADLFCELPAVLGGPTLSTDEVKRVTALVTELGLTPEYVITLAAFLTETRKRRVHIGAVVNECARLHGKEIRTCEELESYIERRRRESSAVYEIGKEIFGIRGRSLSDEEMECFTRWSEEFGFGAPIIKQAYSYAAPRQTQGYPLGLMDYILTEWHKAGCRTVSDCQTEHARNKDKYKSYTPVKEQQKAKAAEYADFDPEEAMKAALLRSYGDNKV